MATGNEVSARSHTQLEPHEATLLELAGTTSPRDIVSLSRKELQILELYDRVQEQELETALLSQDYTEPTLNDDDIDIEEQLETAERELLDARSTYSVKRKAIEVVLMADPSIQSVHAVSGSPAERTLLPLINRRDLLSLIYTNLSRAHASCTQSLSTAKVESIHSTAKNQKLVQTLLGLTSAETSWREEITDQLRSQLETLEKETKDEKANWVTIKRIVSAAIVASGIDWAADEELHDLVVDDDADDDGLDHT